MFVLAKLYSTNIEDLLIAAGLIKDDNRVIPIAMKPSLEQRVYDLEKKVSGLMIDNTIFK